MQDDNVSREQLLANLDELRRRVEKLEDENSSLRQKGSTSNEGSTRKRPHQVVQDSSVEIQALNERLMLEVSERRQTESVLSEHLGMLESILEHAADGICVCHNIEEFPYVRFTHWNPRMIEITGYSMVEINKSGWYQAMYPDAATRQAAIDRMARMRVGDDIRAEEWVITTKEGTETPLAISTSVIKDQDGKTHVLAIMQEISVRKQYEGRLRESEEKFRALSEATFEAIFLSDKGICVGQNLTAERMFGYTEHEALGRSGTEWIAPEHRQSVLQNMLSGCEEPYESVALRKDGTTFPCEIQGRMLKYQGRQIRVTALRDITERTKAQMELRSSEELFRALIDAMDESFGMQNERGILTYVNRKHGEMLGYSKEELIGSRLADFLEEQSKQTLLSQFAERREGKSGSYELTFVRKDGNHVVVIMSGNPIFDQDGRFKGSFGVATDITQRKRAEDALRESETRFKLFMHHFPGLAYIKDAEGHILYANSGFKKYLGIDESLIVGKTNREVFPSDFSDKITADDQRVLESGVSEEIEESYGGSTWTTIKFPILDQGTQPFLGGFTIDVTDRKKAEEALRRNEAFLAAVWRTSPVGIAVARDRVFTWANQAWAKMHGYTDPHEIVGLSTATSYASDAEFERTGKFFYETLKTQDVADTEVHCRRKDGSSFYGHMWLTRVDPRNPDEGAIGAIVDITEGKRAEQALKESEQRYRTLFEESIDGVYSVRRDGEITDANASFCSLFGYTRDDIIGKDIRELYCNTADRPKFQEQIEKIGFVKDYAVKLMRKDGKELDCLLTSSVHYGEDGRIAGYSGIVRDVTDQQLLQRQLLQAQKMEAVGTLAGGMAHDFNNILQAILGYSDLILMKRGRGDPDRKKLEVIQQAARDGAELVSRILTFSRKAESKRRPVDLNEEIRKAQKLLRRTIPRMIDIRLVLEERLRIIEADPGQIEQILLNLAVNAHHAMPDGGKLLIETSNCSFSDDYLRAHLGAKAERYVLLNVSDTGTGMDLALQDRIFEPFFTTKTDGEGTGLGLSMVHGIVSQHGGYIRCYSEPGKGTSFKIYLPVSDRDLDSDLAPTREMPALGTESILLVDDDDRIREMGRQMIEMGGYTVLTAKSGEEALEVYSLHKEEIALVILDLIMPGMGGSLCLRELIRIKPDVRVLVASGYSSDGFGRGQETSDAKGFVSKPYDARNILSAIRRVLDEG